MRRRHVVLGVLVAVATSAWSPSSGAAATFQVARSEQGLFAQGWVEVPFADGSTRRIDVTMAVPRGPATATPALPSVDLGRPWTVVTQRDMLHGTTTCERVSNPERWDEGSLSLDGRTWTGTSVDVACDDGAGFLFYRMTWSPGPFWLVTNQAATATMGGLVTSWSTDDVAGTVTLRALANEQAVVTVCGHRADGVDCFGGASGWGAVIPSVDGMTAQARSS